MPKHNELPEAAVAAPKLVTEAPTIPAASDEPQAARDCRETRHKYFMNIAMAVRLRANCKGNRVGAIIVSTTASSPPDTTALPKTCPTAWTEDAMAAPTATKLTSPEKPTISAYACTPSGHADSGGRALRHLHQRKHHVYHHASLLWMRQGDAAGAGTFRPLSCTSGRPAPARMSTKPPPRPPNTRSS